MQKHNESMEEIDEINLSLRHAATSLPNKNKNRPNKRERLSKSMIGNYNKEDDQSLQPLPYKPIKLKSLHFNLRMDHLESNFMKDQKLLQKDRHFKADFYLLEKILLKRRELLYPEYDLRKLWNDILRT
jgi:hypothetical protein